MKKNYRPITHEVIFCILMEGLIITPKWGFLETHGLSDDDLMASPDDDQPRLSSSRRIIFSNYYRQRASVNSDNHLDAISASKRRKSGELGREGAPRAEAMSTGENGKILDFFHPLSSAGVIWE